MICSWIKKLICRRFCDRPEPKGVLPIPNLSDIVSNIKSYPLVNPNEILANLGYEDIQADVEYYALPKKKWIKLLTRIYNEINKLVQYKLEIFDCIAGDTPLIIKDSSGNIDIKTIRELMNGKDFLNAYGKYQVLTRDGYKTKWTDILYIRKKGESNGLKAIYSRSTCCFISTKGHFVYKYNPYPNLEEVMVRDIVKGDILATANIWDLFRDDLEIPTDLAWAWGYFVGDGSVTFRKTGNEIIFYTTDYKVAERLVNILNDYYDKLEWFIDEQEYFKAGAKTNLGVRTKPLLRVKSHVKKGYRGYRQKLVEEFRCMFYTEDRKKKIPIEILNATPDAKESFLTGYFDADGHYEKNNKSIKRTWDTNSSVLAFQMAILLRKLGRKFSIYVYERNGKIYYKIGELIQDRKVDYYKKYYNVKYSYSRSVKVRCKELNVKQDIYQIITKDRTLLAGGIYAHNCDDYALIYCSLSQLFYFLNVEDKSVKHQIAIGVAWSDVHAYNVIIDDKENVWIYEPQLNQIVSDILNPPNSLYKTKKIMFLG